MNGSEPACVQQALEHLPTTERVRKACLTIEIEYSSGDGVRWMLADLTAPNCPMVERQRA